MSFKRGVIFRAGWPRAMIWLYPRCDCETPILERGRLLSGDNTLLAVDPPLGFLGRAERHKITYLDKDRTLVCEFFNFLLQKFTYEHVLLKMKLKHFDVKQEYLFGI